MRRLPSVVPGIGDRVYITVLRAVLVVTAALSGACISAEPLVGKQGPSMSDLSEWEGEEGEGGSDTAGPGGSGGSGGSEEPECEEGDTRDCRVELGIHEGVKSCFTGVETCSDGAWGHCAAPVGPADGESADGESEEGESADGESED